jgi:hypothetical protein
MKTNGEKGVKGPKVRFLYPSSMNAPKQSDSECILLLIAAHTDHSICHVQRLTTQHIYCISTVQTVQSATELYLQ